MNNLEILEVSEDVITEFKARLRESKIHYTFSVGEITVYVEEFDISGVTKYQALYASGNVISEMTTSKKEAVKLALKASNNMVDLLMK